MFKCDVEFRSSRFTHQSVVETWTSDKKNRQKGLIPNQSIKSPRAIQETVEPGIMIDFSLFYLHDTMAAMRTIHIETARRLYSGTTSCGFL